MVQKIVPKYLLVVSFNMPWFFSSQNAGVWLSISFHDIPSELPVSSSKRFDQPNSVSVVFPSRILTERVRQFHMGRKRQLI